MKRIWFLLFVFLLIVAVLLQAVYVSLDADRERPDGFFFGVSFGQKTAREAKLLIDEVKGYTNFFIVNSWDISTNETALNEVCDYAAENGLSFTVFFDFISVTEHGYPWHREWILTAKDRWKDKFLGIYIYDEPGGKQIDTGLFDESYHGELANIYENASTYSEAAKVFTTELPMTDSFQYLERNNIQKFVSDYALYWFDYQAGYDTVFVELGWNHSTPQHIGLCRGAANAQGKEWGAIIVWKSTQRDPSSVKNGTEMLQDMLTAYESGAKYVVVFNFPQYPETNPFGILTEEHFTAMKQFWEYAGEFPEEYGKTEGEVAFVLPADYGWGMRRPDDGIWGLWPSDEYSPVIWENMNKLIERYGLRLDIVYEDPRYNFENYSEVYFWNGTIS